MIDTINIILARAVQMCPTRSLLNHREKKVALLFTGYTASLDIEVQVIFRTEAKESSLGIELGIWRNPPGICREKTHLAASLYHPV